MPNKDTPEPARKVKWGVIGSGGIARRRTIPEGILPAHNAELIAVFDVNAEVNQAVARQFHAIAAESIAHLLHAGIDAVYVATPAHLHGTHVLECARAGKPVLCEKPLGMGVSEAEAMIRACAQAGVQLGTAFMMRFQAQHQSALQMIQEGRLGKMVSGRAQLSCWYPPIAGAWRQDPALGGGGALIDMGGHCIDLIEMFFGPVKRVACFTRQSVHDYASEDSAVALLQFAQGAMATVDTFFCIPDACSKNALELYGSEGSIVATGTIGQGSQGEMMACLQSEGTSYDAQQNRAAQQWINVQPKPVNPYQAEIEEFSQALIEQRPCRLNADLGLRSQKVISACYQSAQTGMAVDIA